MKLSQLNNLVAIAEAGSIRQASRDLNLSQSALTKSIQQLELYLNTKLLNRESHGVSLTIAGKALFDRAKIVDAEIRNAHSDVESIRDAIGGEIRILASPSVAIGQLPKAIVRFKNLRPNTNFRIDEGVYPENLSSVRIGDADFAICMLPERLVDNALTPEFLIKDRLTLAVRSGSPLAKKKNLSLKQLRERGWVTYQRSRSSRDIFSKLFHINGLQLPENLIECSSLAATISLIANSNLITIFPRHMFTDNSIDYRITPLSLNTRMPAWNIAVIFRSRHALSPISRAFLEELRTVYGLI